ncbi:mitochondrial basic amino acids transporter isoform X1 [Panthera leo]|nr:mitochondrial basic amino acids transporter isoform X1 [Panthera leo]XP_042800216.1 mitochondrial basic amino acids transporter isoform X1 [Panthera leo]
MVCHQDSGEVWGGASCRDNCHKKPGTSEILGALYPLCSLPTDTPSLKRQGRLALPHPGIPKATEGCLAPWCSWRGSLLGCPQCWAAAARRAPAPPAHLHGALSFQVRLQVQSMERPQYRGTLHCFQSIVKQESVLGLYKGLGSPLMGLTFINALVFGVQGNTLRALGRDTPLNQFLAGAAAGAIQCVICCPMELAKTRLQLQDAGPARTYRGSLHCLAHIYRQEGLRGVNRGMASTLLRETPSFGVYFLSYDVLTRALGCEPGDRLLVPKLLLAGGTSGIVSWLSTYPVDVVKSRLQADGVRGAPRYGGFVDCVRQSYRAEGWRVFTRGLASTLLRAFPVNAATFATVTVVLTYARGPEARPEGDAVPAPSGPGLAQPSSL